MAFSISDVHVYYYHACLHAAQVDACWACTLEQDRVKVHPVCAVQAVAGGDKIGGTDSGRPCIRQAKACG